MCICGIFPSSKPTISHASSTSRPVPRPSGGKDSSDSKTLAFGLGKPCEVIIIHSRFKSIKLEELPKHICRTSTSGKIGINIDKGHLFSFFYFSAILNFMTFDTKNLLEMAHFLGIAWNEGPWVLYPHPLLAASNAVVQSPARASFFRTEVALVNFKKHTFFHGKG